MPTSLYYKQYIQYIQFNYNLNEIFKDMVKDTFETNNF